MIVFNIVKVILRVFLFFVFRIKVYGKENMPKDGGIIVAINHRSYWDVIVAGVCTPRRLGFMAKAELFKNKFFGWLITSLGAFPVQRGKGDIGAIKAALTRLRDGEVVAMFPEGTRVKKGQKGNAKPGAVMLATKAQIPIVPVKISGGYKWMSKVNVLIGEPVEYSAYYGEKLTIETLQGLSDDLLHKIYALD
ncbi:MAG: 1-acyl-sn-glycerol-3-phosphate acyltransferase [Clostridia bacterium]|nr:1-acyl-sn-glycerol-3-phosphate acyltransferase [Clostridia bacterium]